LPVSAKPLFYCILGRRERANLTEEFPGGHRPFGDRREGRRVQVSSARNYIVVDHPVLCVDTMKGFTCNDVTKWFVTAENTEKPLLMQAYRGQAGTFMQWGRTAGGLRRVA